MVEAVEEEEVEVAEVVEAIEVAVVEVAEEVIVAGKKMIAEEGIEDNLTVVVEKCKVEGVQLEENFGMLTIKKLTLSSIYQKWSLIICC